MVDEDSPVDPPLVLPRYARLFEPPRGPTSRARREASAAARRCLEALRFRFAEPEALFVVELLIRLGGVGAFDLEGSLRKIGMQIGELLGEQPDQVRLYRGIRALAGRTCLVERISRQIWRLCLAGITDPTSPRHRRLLDETPSPCHLESTPRALPQPQARADATHGELDRVDAETREAAAERDELRAELAALREQHGRMDAEVEALCHERDEAVRIGRAQAETFAAELRRFDEVSLERDIKIEDLERQLAAARQAQIITPTARDEADKQVALKATLKAERERRKTAEERLRQVLSALRIKVDAGSGPHPAVDVDFDRVLWSSLSKILGEHLDALEAESEDVDREPDHAAARQADIELTEGLVLGLGLRVPRESKTSSR